MAGPAEDLAKSLKPVPPLQFKSFSDCSYLTCKVRPGCGIGAYDKVPKRPQGSFFQIVYLDIILQVYETCPWFDQAWQSMTCNRHTPKPWARMIDACFRGDRQVQFINVWNFHPSGSWRSSSTCLRQSGCGFPLQRKCGRVWQISRHFARGSDNRITNNMLSWITASQYFSVGVLWCSIWFYLFI